MTILKTSLFFSFLCSASALFGASQWQASFDDKPVTAEEAAAVEAALPVQALVEVSKPRRVLLVSSTAGYRHSSIPIGKLALEKMGLSTGAYETVISDDPKNFAPEVLATFDAVILLNTSQDFFMPNRKQRKDFPVEEWRWLQRRHNSLIDNLTAYVKGGGGLVGLHAASDACYKHPDFGGMMGGFFDGHPWRAKHNVTIVVEDPENAVNKPVFGPMKDFQIKEEIYQFREEPYSREKLRILLHLDPKRSDPVEGLKRQDNDYAVAWIQSYGEGRVFYSSLGHNHEIFSNPLLLKHFLAGIQFAAGDLKADTTPSGKISIPHALE